MTMLGIIDLGNVYFVFATGSAIGALWMMQATTSDAGVQTSLSIVKLSHRAGLALVSVVLFASACETLYFDSVPRPLDFLVQFVLIVVLGMSAIRHMYARSAQSSHNPRQASFPRA